MVGAVFYSALVANVANGKDRRNGELHITCEAKDVSVGLAFRGLVVPFEMVYDSCGVRTTVYVVDSYERRDGGFPTPKKRGEKLNSIRTRFLQLILDGTIPRMQADLKNGKMVLRTTQGLARHRGYFSKEMVMCLEQETATYVTGKVSIDRKRVELCIDGQLASQTKYYEQPVPRLEHILSR